MKLTALVMGAFHRPVRSPLERAVSRAHISPKLALAVLTGNYSPNEKFDVIRRVRAEMKYPAPLYEPCDSILPLAGMANLLPLFRLLAAQPKNVVSEASQLWRASKPDIPSFMVGAERYLRAISKGYSLVYEGAQPVTPRAEQTVIGYLVDLGKKSGELITDHLYFISGCRIDGLTFDYQFRP